MKLLSFQLLLLGSSLVVFSQEIEDATTTTVSEESVQSVPEVDLPTPNLEEESNETWSEQADSGDEAAEASNNGSAAATAAAPSVSKRERLWGAPSTGGTESSSATTTTLPPSAQSESSSGATGNASNESMPPQSPHLPFVSKSGKASHPPPEGFVISARVYIDSTDKLARLDETPINLPYFDCGVTGSTTAPLPVKDAIFRHSLISAATPWTGTDGKHPLLAVALSPLVIETNSGESKSIQAGQVILLEDVLMEGHKLLPLHNQELQVLFLTLPQTHYHAGKDRVSLHSSKKNGRSSVHPCPVPKTGEVVKPRTVLSAQNIRRTLLGVIGLSLSALAAEFFSKTAPLWLAVGVGGTCFVAAGTTLTVWTGEMVLTSLEVWFEQRRLAATQSNTPKTTIPAATATSTAAVDADEVQETAGV